MTETSAVLPTREAAKAVIIDPHTMTALVLRLSEQERQERNIDEWHIPGGSKDSADESTVETALREVREETGLTSGQLHYLGELGRDEWDALYEGQPTHFLAMFLAFALRDGVSTDIVIGEESSDSAWVSEADMADYPALTSQARQFIPQAIALTEEYHGR